MLKGIPKKILLRQGFAWLIDEEKTKNGEQNNPEEIKLFIFLAFIIAGIVAFISLLLDRILL